MTFDKQVKEAKRKQVESRIVRDVVFLVLGITFLLISIFSAANEKKDNNSNKENNTKQTTVVNKQ